MSTAPDKPNYATVQLAQPGLPPGHFRTGTDEEVVQGFINHRIDHGALVFELPDGAVIAYGAGHWSRVEMTFEKDCVPQ